MVVYHHKPIEFMEKSISIHYWRDEIENGRWYCWAYYRDQESLKMYQIWLEENMKGTYKTQSRFNSGNPMVETSIYDEADAALFKLTWIY